MSTYTRIIYQVVFATKYREPVLEKAGRPALFAYMAGVLQGNRCKVYAIGGVEDHVHLLFDLHPAVALSEVVKDVKLAASKHMKASGQFPYFDRWQSGYGAFTYSRHALPGLIAYVHGQEAHHADRSSSKEELRQLLITHQVTYEQRYLT